MDKTVHKIKIRQGNYKKLIKSYKKWKGIDKKEPIYTYQYQREKRKISSPTLSYQEFKMKVKKLPD